MSSVAATPWWEMLAEQLSPTPNPYNDKPVEWISVTLDEHTTLAQQSICGSVVVNRYTAVQSCHDVGKSYIASRISSWWLDTHPKGEAFVVTTAPTAAQVGAILWREIGKAHRKGELFGYVTGSNEWKIDHGQNGQPEIVAYGRKPADTDPAAFQGIHARFVLVIIDEACGVPKTLFEAADSLATNRNARVLAIGNPDDPGSHFATICKPDSGWNVIRIDALDSPNMTAAALREYPLLRSYMIEQGIAPSNEYIPEELRDLLVDPGWVEERLKRWGRDSPIFQSKVRGLFPSVSIDTLIHPHLVTLAQARESPAPTTMARMGVDVARYGVDHTVILVRRMGHCRVAYDIAYGPTTQTTRLVMEVGSAYPMRPVACVDDSGVGGGVVDQLREKGYPVVPIIAGAGSVQLLPSGKPRFFNRRSELLWNVKEALEGPSGTGADGWLDLDPEDHDLAAQLTHIKYKINEYGQIRVESKDDMKARGLPSPDRADALSYSLAPEEPEAVPDQGSMITGDLLTRPL